MKMKKLVAAGMAALLTISTASGALTVRAEEEPVTLKFWTFQAGEEAAYLEKFVQEWNDTHDSVKVEQTVVNQSDYTTTLIPTAYANGEAPDVMFVEPATFRKYAEKGMLADLSPYYTDELKEDLLPSALEASTYDGKQLSLPYEMETLGLFYNKDMLAEAGVEPPKTWDELYEAAKQLTTDDVYGLVLPVEKTSYTLFNFWPFVWMSGADILSEDGKECKVNSKEMAEALDYWGRFYQEGLAPSSLQIGPYDIGNVGTGIAAMQISGTYVINAAESTYQDVNIGVVPLPYPDGKESVTVAGGQRLAVNANSEHVEEAAEFIMWLFGGEDITHLTDWTTKAKFAYPARQSVIDQNKEIFEEGLRKTFTEFYVTAVPEPSYSAEVTDALSDMLQEVMFSGSTGADAAAAAEKTINAALN
ncbi:MAG: sugar ABC transporter substrate-binding protein [Eubacteriales bacterium]|nr:sugar ABC transporter substrate-binding protein [Eubacteriales bacterium]